MSFGRHGRDYPPMALGAMEARAGCRLPLVGPGCQAKERDGRSALWLIVWMSHATGYSSASCSPALLASASPASAIMLGGSPPRNSFAANGNPCLNSLSQPRGPLQLLTRVPTGAGPYTATRRQTTATGSSMFALSAEPGDDW
jgi:hypothetical protein